MKWEGNEACLRDLDNVLASSTRPALISPLFGPKSPSHQYVKTPSSVPAPPPATTSSLGSALGIPFAATLQMGGVRVVGDMIFDPLHMRWVNTGRDGEDELDFGDDEGEDGESIGSKPDYWGEGEAMRLKTRKSFARVTASASEQEEDVPWDVEDFAKITFETQKRHDKELQLWANRKRLTIGERRAQLWDILSVSFDFDAYQ